MTAPDAKTLAEIDKLRAEAAKTQAEADKLTAEAAKARAEADKLTADTATTQATLDDQRSPAAALAKASAHRKSAAEAERDAATARRQSVSALLPKLETVKASPLQVSGEELLWAPVAAHQALLRVAEGIRDQLATALPANGPTVLVTTDADLLAAETAYQQVTRGITRLTDAAALVVAELDRDLRTVQNASFTPVGDVVAAIAAALPAALSLFTADRSVTTGAQSVSEQAAIAAVIGALDPGDRNRSFSHPTFRLIHASVLYSDLDALDATLEQLKARRLVIERAKIAAVAEAERDKAALAAALAAEAKREKDKLDPDPALSDSIERLTQAVSRATAAIADAEAKLTYLELYLTAAAGFMDTVRSPAGGRSPLDVAVIHERLHRAVPDGTHAFSHVLLLGVEGGAGYQSVSNRPLWFQDKFSTSVDVTLSYLLLDVARNAIIGSGVVSRTASAFGNIGSRMTVTIDEANSR